MNMYNGKEVKMLENREFFTDNSTDVVGYSDPEGSEIYKVFNQWFGWEPSVLWQPIIKKNSVFQ